MEVQIDVSADALLGIAAGEPLRALLAFDEKREEEILKQAAERKARAMAIRERQEKQLQAIKDKVSRVMSRNKDKPVLIWGDQSVPYGEVVTVMVALQEAGAPSVGLVTENP